MPIICDFTDFVVYITSPTTDVTVQELVNEIRDAEVTMEGFGYDIIIDAVGKADLGGGVTTAITLTLNPDWYIEWWNGVTLGTVYGGNVVGGTDNRPIRCAVGSSDTALVLSAEAATLVAVGSAVTEQDKLDIADRVWDEDLTTHDAKGSAGSAQRASLYDNAITIDIANGEAGTTWPIGTHKYPVNNLADALTIASANNIDDFYIHGPITIGATDVVDGYSFRGHQGWGAEVTLTSGCSVDETSYRYLMLSGEASIGDTLLIESCTVGTLTNFNGIMHIVEFNQASEITVDAWANLIETTAGGDPANEPEISLGSAAVTIARHTGNIKLKDKTGSNRTTVGLTGGNIIIDSTCVAGIIQLLGHGYIEADNSGVGCDVDSEGFLSSVAIADQVWDELKAEHTAVGSFGEAIGSLPASPAPAGEYDAELAAIQADLDDPDQYKADVSALALEATLQLVKTETDKIVSLETLIAFISDIEGGRWKIENNQMIFYKDDNVTEVARFNLYDAAGDPAETDVFERERV